MPPLWRPAMVSARRRDPGHAVMLEMSRKFQNTGGYVLMELVLKNSSGCDQIRVTLDSPRYMVMEWASTQFQHHFMDGDIAEVARWARALAAALEVK